MLALPIMTTSYRKPRNTNLSSLYSAMEQAHIYEDAIDYTADAPLDSDEEEFYADEEEEEAEYTGTHREHGEDQHHHQPTIGAEKGVYRARIPPRLQTYVSRAVTSFLARYERLEPRLFAEHDIGPRDIILVRAIYSRDLRRWRSQKKDPVFQPNLPYEEAFSYFHLYRVQFARATIDRLLTRALKDLAADMRLTATRTTAHTGGSGAAERRAERRHPRATPDEPTSLWEYTRHIETRRVPRDQNGIQQLEALARVDLQRIASIGTANIVRNANARIRITLYNEIYSIAREHAHLPHEVYSIGQDLKRSESEMTQLVNGSGTYYERMQRTSCVRIIHNLERLKQARREPGYDSLNGAHGEWTGSDDTFRFCHSSREPSPRDATGTDCLHNAIANAICVPPDRMTRQYTYGYPGGASALYRYSHAMHRTIHVFNEHGVYSITASTSTFPDVYLVLLDYHYTVATHADHDAMCATIESYRYSDLLYRPRMSLEDIGADLDGNGDRLANMAAIADAFGADVGRGHHVRQVFINNDDDTANDERPVGVPRQRPPDPHVEPTNGELKASFDMCGTTNSSHPLSESDAQRAERGVILAQNLQHSTDRMKATHLEELRHAVNKTTNDALVARMKSDEASIETVRALRRADADTVVKIRANAALTNAPIAIGGAQGDLDRTLEQIATARKLIATVPEDENTIRSYLVDPSAIAYFDAHCASTGAMAPNSGTISQAILAAASSAGVSNATDSEIAVLQAAMNLHGARHDKISLLHQLERHTNVEKRITLEALDDLSHTADVLNAKYDRAERAADAEHQFTMRSIRREAVHAQEIEALRQQETALNAATKLAQHEREAVLKVSEMNRACSDARDQLRVELDCKTSKLPIRIAIAAVDDELLSQKQLIADDSADVRLVLKAERHARTGHRLAGMARTAALLAADAEAVSSAATVTPDYLARLAAGLHATESIALGKFASDMREAERQWKITDMRTNGPSQRKERSCPIQFRPLTKELYEDERPFLLDRMAVDALTAVHGYQGKQRYRIRPPLNLLAPPSPLRDLVDRTDIVQVVIFNNKLTRSWRQFFAGGLLSPWKRSARNILNASQEDYYSLGRWHNPDAARPIYDGNMYTTPELMLSSSRNAMVPILNNYKFLGIGFSTLRDLLGSTDDYIAAKKFNHYSINMVSPIVYAEATKLAIGTNCGMLMVNNILRSLRDFHELVPLDLLYNSISAAVQHVDILRHMVMSQHPNAASSLPN
jgi:hypothetical protein